ncbi:MAG: hypothetical protein A2498_02785 [Lentisphaerae bacterium RIFOXYC12_FULL_60_16]|nr:MAG: hypothetical protein A2498_02785 [Lentisphaerae bacterium RIFOXYC12_FULL_60_16]OGV75295.1 MAG: hypothetical protein A2340_05820 [Lentisphaerae bacterium RIFOXYB12_FULL_60_10]
MKPCSSQSGAPRQNPGEYETDTDGALAASELRYRRLFEAAKDGILILNAESGMVVDVNPFLIDLLGYSRTEFLGKKVWELGVFKNLAANEAKFLELQAREYVRYEDLPLETIDGRLIAVEFVSNVYHENNLRVIQCNIRNITERKRADVYWEMGREVLETLNGPEEWKDAIRHVLDIFKSRTGFEANTAFIAKPFTRSELAHKIHETLDLRKDPA